MAAIHLFYMAVDVAQVFLLPLKIFLGMLDDYHDEDQRHRDDTQRYQGHLPADREHHHQNTNESRSGSDNLGNTLVEGKA